MHVDTLIIGAGPGGLACAKALAGQGQNVLVLERKFHIGKKVCAGGVTYSGLISRLPADLVERSFSTQHVYSKYQHCAITEKSPIIATVNREKLGLVMAAQATAAGAVIRCATIARKIKKNSAEIYDKTSRNTEIITFDYLVGADGSSSLVRRSLGLKCEKFGVGINYTVAGSQTEMEWHLNSKLFANGYAWIFPHTDTVSVGAYAPKSRTSPARLKKALIQWGQKQGYSLAQEKAKAEYINFDFRGWKFNRVFLAGDAAGLASGLTGEGIYPAILSGEQIAATILNSGHSTKIMDDLIKRHRQHSRMLSISGKSEILNTLLSELMTLGLRSGIVRFSQMEMAG